MFLNFILTAALVAAVYVAWNYKQLHEEAENDLADVLASLGVQS